jgi:hypothetical protein
MAAEGAVSVTGDSPRSRERARQEERPAEAIECEKESGTGDEAVTRYGTSNAPLARGRGRDEGLVALKLFLITEKGMMQAQGGWVYFFYHLA